MSKRACATGGSFSGTEREICVFISPNLVVLQRDTSACRLASRFGSAIGPRLTTPGCSLCIPASAERWLRGRKHRTRNAACRQRYRGFESHPLRQTKRSRRSNGMKPISLQIDHMTAKRWVASICRLVPIAPANRVVSIQLNADAKNRGCRTLTTLVQAQPLS